MQKLTQWLLCGVTATALAMTSLLVQAQSAAFNQLIADYESWQSAEDPIRQGRRGNMEALARWPDSSAAAVSARNIALETFTERLSGIDSASLAESERTSYAVLEYLLRSQSELAAFAPERIPFQVDSGFFSTPLQVAASTRMPSMEHAEAWIQRLENIPQYLVEHQVWLQQGLNDGFTQPAYVVEAVIEQVQAIVDTAAMQVLMQPFDSLPARFDEAQRTALRNRGRVTVQNTVIPAYRELLDYLQTVYLPSTRTSIGIADVPGGKDYYRALVRQHTTLDTTPEAVHERGRSEVARIRAEMEEVVARTGFEGEFAEFLHFMRTDERFYAKTPDELLMRAAWLAKRADDQMPRFFYRLPRLSYGVRPVPDHLAPTYTSGRYWGGDLESGVAGGYMVNTYALDQRPLYELPALTVHEAVPGHHHQGALAREVEDVPDFRRNAYITAFGEGWALYTEQLAIEMGMYDTPYDHFGRLTFEMWRACRLVVDTGMHYFGWSREEAEACLLENSALAPHNVRTEVARYIAWPGQALAYKTGELLIRDLRGRAEQRLGERFDIRAFHDRILDEGAVPLDYLEEKMQAWIETQATP